MEKDSLQRAGEKDEAAGSMLKKLESARDKLHGLNPCWKFFDILLCNPDNQWILVYFRGVYLV